MPSATIYLGGTPGTTVPAQNGKRHSTRATIRGTPPSVHTRRIDLLLASTKLSLYVIIPGLPGMILCFSGSDCCLVGSLLERDVRARIARNRFTRSPKYAQIRPETGFS